MDRDRDTRLEMRMLYAAYRVAGFSKIKSAIEAGYAESGASSRADKLEKRQDVQDRMLALREGYLSEELKGTDLGRKILAENAARGESESILKTMAREILRDELEVLLFDPKCLFDHHDGHDVLRPLKEIKRKHRRVITSLKVKTFERDKGDSGVERETDVEVKWSSKDAAKQRFLDYLGPSNKVEVAKMLAELRTAKSPKADDDQHAGDRPQAIFNIPNNGRTYAEKDKA